MPSGLGPAFFSSRLSFSSFFSHLLFCIVIVIIQVIRFFSLFIRFSHRAETVGVCYQYKTKSSPHLHVLYGGTTYIGPSWQR